MRILYLTRKGSILTGSGTYRDNVLREMSKRHDIKVFESEDDLKKDWDIVHVLDVKHFESRLLNKITAPLLIEIHDYQWVQFHPFVAIDLPIRFLLQKYRKRKYLNIIEKADGIIAHSRYVLDRISSNKKFLVTIGIDASRFENQTKNPGENKILMVGRDYFQKGLYTAIKALPTILREVPDASLTVIGKEYPHSKAIARLLSKNLPVTYIDGVPQQAISSYYSDASVFIHPSEIEGFGIVLLEAMASGLPIVASNAGGIPEVIQDGINGFLVERGNHKRLAEQVVALLKFPEKASKLVREGKRTVKDKFRIESMLDDIERVYVEMKKQGTSVRR